MPSTSPFRYHALQRRNPNAILKLPDTQNNIDVATNEPVVGGVYLRLFIASPAWALRKPKEFLSELMDTTLTLMSKEKTDVSVTKSVPNADLQKSIYRRYSLLNLLEEPCGA